MVMLADSGGRVLVRLSEITQELMVGIGGASASVRTLTDVSLEVRERELVVLSGSRGAGERAMLAVIAGDRRGVTGSCEIRPRTRMRLMRMGPQAALALTQEWQRCESLAYFSALDTASDIEADFLHNEIRPPAASQESSQQSLSDRTSDLILLDVSEDARPWDEKNRSALLAWAGICRSRGGAVVMAAGDAVGNGIFDAALSHVRPDESKRAQFPSTVREVRIDASTVRVVPMHCGRLGAPVRLRSNDLTS